MKGLLGYRIPKMKMKICVHNFMVYLNFEIDNYMVTKEIIPANLEKGMYKGRITSL